MFLLVHVSSNAIYTREKNISEKGGNRDPSKSTQTRHITDTTTPFHHHHFSTHLTFSIATQITLNHYISHSKHASLQPLHSYPEQKSNHSYSNKITIQILNNMYACTNEKYLIPISVPILPHTIPQDSIIPHTTNFVWIVEGMMV